MGTILSSKLREDGKVVLEVSLDQEEALQLRGHYDLIHVFTEHVEGVGAQISGRGKNEATKYFLIPKNLRTKFNLKSNTPVHCQKLETPTKIIFVYTIDKLRT
ncbi:MAG: hypothetical protein KC535_05880 [Nanoarchaeota archaeon]|nr:hypothetical protein [Nanoarchaeota archaeon]